MRRLLFLGIFLSGLFVPSFSVFAQVPVEHRMVLDEKIRHIEQAINKRNPAPIWEMFSVHTNPLLKAKIEQALQRPFTDYAVKPFQYVLNRDESVRVYAYYHTLGQPLDLVSIFRLNHHVFHFKREDKIWYLIDTNIHNFNALLRSDMGILALSLGVLVGLFWLWMLVHACRFGGRRKTWWILVIILLAPIGALLYYFIKKRPSDQAVILVEGTEETNGSSPATPKGPAITVEQKKVEAVKTEDLPPPTW